MSSFDYDIMDHRTFCLSSFNSASHTAILDLYFWGFVMALIMWFTSAQVHSFFEFWILFSDRIFMQGQLFQFVWISSSFMSLI